jgi:ATP-dependent RNA helicase DDX54/DBP10
LRSYRHTKITEAKPLDPKSNSYERKLRQIEGKKRAAAEEAGGAFAPPSGKKGGKPGVGGKAGRNASAVKNEIRSADQIRKQRDIAAKVCSQRLKQLSLAPR